LPVGLGRSATKGRVPFDTLRAGFDAPLRGCLGCASSLGRRIGFYKLLRGTIASASARAACQRKEVWADLESAVNAGHGCIGHPAKLQWTNLTFRTLKEGGNEQ